MASVVLVKYGTIPEVARFQAGDETHGLARGDAVVVRTHRGLQLGHILEAIRPTPVSEFSRPGSTTRDADSDDGNNVPPVVRKAASEDFDAEARLRDDAREAFDVWRQRIEQWDLELELIDLEWTIDRQKLILYVLNSRGPDSTKLALQAAAAGLGIIEVQPVSAEGLVTVPTGGGCGTCGCH